MGDIRVFLVDDHEAAGRGLSDMIDNQDDMAVAGQAGSLAEALVRIPLVLPDVAVLDVRLPDGDGVSLLRELRVRLPALPCLMVTSYAGGEAMVEDALAGASGFVLTQILGADLLSAIRSVASGRTLMSRRTAAGVADRRRSAAAAREAGRVLEVLSDQERTVFDLIAEGLSNRQIADRMSLAEKTIKNYASHVFAKLELQRRTQVVLMAAALKRPS